MRASRMVLAIDPAEAFEALCALERRANLSHPELVLAASLRQALRPAADVTLRALAHGEAR